ncbi:toxin-antitoxin system YwqK family antitoxin [Fusobacterium polymorphum]|uniref:toxin-antitoxin system YwqK family antitoxin n=2 Tax=Fusobacterium nucleatum subsp. polymorphum TaxID=76857 RepID=UPI003008E5D7
MRKYYESGELKEEIILKDENNILIKRYYKNGKIEVELNLKNKKAEGISKGYYENGQIKFEYNYKDGQLNGLCKEYYENGQLASEGNFIKNQPNGLHKKYNINLNTKKEILYEKGRTCLEKITYDMCQILGLAGAIRTDYYLYYGDIEEISKKILYQQDLITPGTSEFVSNNITKYLELNGEKNIISEMRFYNDNGIIKEKEIINDTIKVKIDGEYKNLTREYCDYVYSYKDIIGKIEIFNKEIFFEREFIREGKLNGLKVLYKKNNGTKEYINIELYENDIKIEDNLENRKRLLAAYIMSDQEKEEWINIPFITDKNYNDIDIESNINFGNNNSSNFKETGNKLLYIIIPIIIFLILIGFFVYKQFEDDKDYQPQISKEKTTFYSQPQQYEIKQNVIKNNNLNEYIPTAEDAKYISYRTYYNDNYGYSIDYPDDSYFKISANYENGIELKNNNGKVVISVDSVYDDYGEDLQEAYDRVVRERPNAPYKFLGKTFFTITYQENGLLIFRKTVYNKDTGKYIYLYVSFPPEYKEYMTQIVEKIANSMKKYNPTISNKKIDEIAKKDYYQNGVTIGSFLDKDIYTVEVQAMLYNSSGVRLVLVEAENGEYMLLENAYGYGNNIASDWKEYVDKGIGMETVIPIVHLTGNIYKNLVFPNKQEALNYANIEGLKLYKK